MDTLKYNQRRHCSRIYLLAFRPVFCVGPEVIKQSRDSARRGNLWAATGMILAMIATYGSAPRSPGNAIGGGNLALFSEPLPVGGIIGAVIARRD
jgi:NAD/NADP transhydrogenase beta subunit